MRNDFRWRRIIPAALPRPKTWSRKSTLLAVFMAGVDRLVGRLRKESHMSNPVVLITGALTGIGRATALAFGHEGARLVVSGRRDDAGNALVAQLRAIGVEAEFVRADVRHEEDVRGLVDKTVA